MRIHLSEVHEHNSYSKAISGKESPGLTCLFAQGLRCPGSYIALLCARRSALPLHKYAAPYRKIILGKHLS